MTVHVNSNTLSKTVTLAVYTNACTHIWKNRNGTEL